jgi:hypothetical protein
MEKEIKGVPEYDRVVSPTREKQYVLLDKPLIALLNAMKSYSEIAEIFKGLEFPLNSKNADVIAGIEKRILETLPIDLMVPLDRRTYKLLKDRAEKEGMGVSTFSKHVLESVAYERIKISNMG